ncbi:MAG: DUF4956 domain-containing protein [Bacteroidia bacterium]
MNLKLVQSVLTPFFILIFSVLPAAATPIPGDFFSLAAEQFTAYFFIRLAVDLLSMVVLIRMIYYPVYRKNDYFFTFFMFNITIFIITHLLNSETGFSMGAAFGLFAIFSMLRYRTEDITARDMTYLFAVITLGLISSVNQGNLIELLLINLLILGVAFLLDGGILIKTERMQLVQYEKIELIRPDKREELLSDLRERTGLNIRKISIDRIDFLRDTALIRVYYLDKQ